MPFSLVKDKNIAQMRKCNWKVITDNCESIVNQMAMLEEKRIWNHSLAT
ncbi:hypothetical protein BH09BAC5_BH09BAC5_15180 [soil metagenome]